MSKKILKKATGIDLDAVNRIAKNLNQEIEKEIFVELSKKGHKFDSIEELKEFVSNNMSIADSRVGQTFLLKGKPLLTFILDSTGTINNYNVELKVQTY